MVESAEVVQLVRPRAGHFDLGTGYHGDLWLDLDALFLRPARLRPYVDWLAERLRGHDVDAVCGPLEGGALLAYAVADRLGVAFLPGYRTPGAASYRLPRVHGGIGGWRVGVVDDAVNAGTAVAACLEELRVQGAVPIAVAAVIALGEASTMVPARNPQQFGAFLLSSNFHDAAGIPHGREECTWFPPTSSAPAPRSPIPSTRRNCAAR